MNRTETIYGFMKKYGLENTEIVVDDWGASSHGFANWNEFPEVKYRDTEYHSAFFAKMVDLYIQELYHKQGENP